MIYPFIISCTCGWEWGLSCMHPGNSLLLVFREEGASPPGPPKFGISILCANGPPFAACQHKIGGFVPAGVLPAERGPVFLLCSMTPLILTLSISFFFRGPLPFLSLHPSSSSQAGEHENKIQQSTTTSHLRRVIWLFVAIE